MIKLGKIKKIAREKKVPPTTVERDYVQNYFLKYLYTRSDSLIFKGGTSIRKAFIEDYRFSDDLDFTMKTNIDQKYISDLLESIIDDFQRKEGIIFRDAIDLKEVDSGWKIDLRYNSLLSQNIQMNLVLDITEISKERIMTPVEKRSLINHYSDELKVDLITYSLEEITLEKLRALCDRGWPRDLYDVYNLWPLINKDNFKELFSKKCEIRDVDPTSKIYDQNKEKIKRAWTKSLNHQLKDVPEFDKCFQKVREILRQIDIK